MKPSERFLIPRAGIRVVDPATMQPLPPKGALVRGNDEHWIRRLNDADVTEGRPASERSNKQTAAASQE